MNKLRTKQDAQLSQRDRAAGCVIVFAKSRRLELGDNILRTLQVYLQPKWCNRPENLSISVKKRKIRAITAFKVIQGHRGRYQSKARMMRFPISD